MKSMRWRAVVLIAWITLLYNIERIAPEDQSPFNLTAFVYVLAVATIGFFLLVPMRRRQMYAATAGVLAIYALLKAVRMEPILWGGHKYITIVEIFALVLTANLSWMMGKALWDFDQAIAAISLPKWRPRLLTYSKFQERIHAAIGHARRHQRPLSVALIEIDPTTFEAALHQAVREAQAAMIERYVQVRFGMFLARHIRETDVIGHYTKNGRFILLAPESAAGQTKEMLARLGQLASEQTGIRFRYSIADFPEMALTAEEMIRMATDELLYRPADRPVPSEDELPELERAVGEPETYATMPNMIRGSDERKPLP
jgi:hypothetical protein